MDKKKKAGRYQRMYEQLRIVLGKSDDTIANMATIAAVLYNKLDYFFWCGFYRVLDEKLVVGPYQGPVACQELQGNGVCVTVVETKEVINVPDVSKFPGHWACDARSRSEMVIPVKNKKGQVVAVLDVDSKELNSFDEVDQENLEKIVSLIHIG